MKSVDGLGVGLEDAGVGVWDGIGAVAWGVLLWLQPSSINPTKVMSRKMKVTFLSMFCSLSLMLGTS